MEFLVGAGLALGVTLFAALAGFDRDRSFYPAILVVVASYYDLFAVMGGQTAALSSETLAFAAFLAASVIGFRTNLWIVAAALLAHGLFDLSHGLFIANPGVPAWWPMFCLSFDAAASASLAWLLISNRIDARGRPGFGRIIRPHVQAELLAAETSEMAGDPAAGFRHLERAHVLGQASTIEHVRVHARMFAWGVRQHHGKEILGQALRIAGAASKTALGLIPHGNTGGANVSPFRPMPVPQDLAGIIAAARTTAGGILTAALLGGAFLGLGACATTPGDARIAMVDGHKLAYRVLGTGQPVVVMLSGLGDGMATFHDVASDLSKTATVIVYDRPGYGGSDMVAGARDAAAAERELTAVLAQSGVSGPYVLAGHSLGGLFAEYYAARHPDQVSGLILEESRPADFGRRCEAAGLSMCTPTPAMAQFAPKGAQGETAGLPATQAQVEAAGPAAGKRVLVLSRSIGKNASPFDALWAVAQRDLAARYPGARHLTADKGGHYVHTDQKDWYAAAVREFLSGME